MKKIVRFSLSLSVFAMSLCARTAHASTYTLTLLTDSTMSVFPGYVAHGSTTGNQGYTMTVVNGQNQRSFFGTEQYTWDRTNTDGTTYTGYYVDTTATDPTANGSTCAYFPTTGTVHWGKQGVGGSGGGGL